jgi:predicted nucleotidyltransferase
MVDTQHFAQYGFKRDQDLIMKFIGGSQLHGAKLEGVDDRDWYGVYIEPKEVIIGIDSEEHFVFTTGGKRGGNGPRDVDVCLYTLRKWARLVAKGNPSVLHFLFAPWEYWTATWGSFAIRQEPFLAKSHVYQFLGFARAQLRRLYNQQGQKNVHRVELEDRYGYDTKYAMHVIRLYGEALEFLRTGKITLPRPNKDELISIRKGEWPLVKFQQYAQELEALCEAEKEKSPLPERVDREVISKLVAKAYEMHWEQVAYRKGGMRENG